MDGRLMRKINGKLFLLLLIGTGLTAAGGFAVHYFQYQRIGKALLWQARRAEEQGQQVRAAKYLTRYLEFNPRDVAEKATLAKLYAGDAYPPGAKQKFAAVTLLDAVLRTDDSQELRRLLVKTALGVGEFTQARDHLNRLLRWEDVEAWVAHDTAFRTRGKPLPDHVVKEDPARGELEGYWAHLMEADRKPGEAMGCYRLAVRHAPHAQVNFVRLAYLLRRATETDPSRRKQNHQEANQVIDGLVRANPASHESYLSRWRYRRDFDLLSVKDAGPAEADKVSLVVAGEDVTQAQKRKPEEVEVLLAAADLERLRGRAAAENLDRPALDRRAELQRHRQRALEYLKRGQELASKNATPAGDQTMFQLLWQKGNLLLDDLDLQSLQQTEEGKPLQIDVALKNEITEVIGQVRRGQMPAAADYIQARLLVHDRQWAEAAALFERARAQLGSQRDLACQADLYLGQCYEKLEEHTQMYNAYQRVLEWDPASVPALLGMATARWSQGQLDNALVQYNAVIRQKRVPARAWIDIARLEIQRQAQNQKADWSQVEKILAAAKEAFQDEDNLELTLLRAELFVRQGKPADARQVLEAARAKKPKEVEYRTALVDLALREKSLTRAYELLTQARRDLGDVASLRLVEARYLVALEGEKGTQKIAKLADGCQRFSEDDQARLLTGLADTLYRNGDTKEARRLWLQLAGQPKHKADLRLQLLLFDLAAKENDEAGMKQALARVQAIEQDSGSYHRYGQALYRVWQARRATDGRERVSLLTEARQDLDRVQERRPSWPAVFLARAEIAELVGNAEQAIKDLQSAVTNGEDSPTVLRRLAGLLAQRGRDSEAQVILAKLQQSMMYATDVGKMAVVMAVRRGEMSQAVDLMRKTVAEDTKDPADLVWMARVLLADKRTQEAEKRLQEAVQLGAKDPTPWLAMVEFQAGQNRVDDALATLAEAKAKLPKDKVALTLARGYDLVGKPKEALGHYQAALAENRQDAATVRAVAAGHLDAGRSRDAEPLLREVHEGKLRGSTPADTDWARRRLALLLANGTDYQRFSEALTLVGQRLDGAGRLKPDDVQDENTENRRVKARVLASQNQRQYRLAAIKLLQELQAQKALVPDDEFVLAMLYEAEGETRKSHETLRTLIEPKTRTPQYLARYASSLMVQRRLADSLDEAERVIGWLEKLEEQRQVGPNGFASVELRANLLEARNKGGEAVDLMRAHVSRKGAKPEEIVLLLGVMTRQKRFTDAFELCEKAWQEGKCMPEVLGSVSVRLLQVMDPTDAQVAAVERHLNAAIAKKPDSTVLLMHLSTFYDKRGQYDRATEAYRMVLQREPSNVVALNNLAWLMAHRSGEAKAALEHINKAVTGIGRRADLLDTRGVVYLALKEPQKALADLKEATDESPTPVRLLHLARAHHEEKDAKKARDLLRQAKEKGLQVATLHPVEQEAAKRLLDEYGIR